MSSRGTPGPQAPPGEKREARSAARPLLNWKTVIGILISGGALYFSFRGQDLGEIARQLTRADPLLLLLATVFATSVFWIRAWRWRAILDPVLPDTRFRSRFAAVNIGFMGNNLLPARVGEFARAYAIARLEPVPVVAALSTLVIERMLDAVSLVTLLFVSMVLPGFPAWPDNASINFPATARRIGIGVGLGALLLFALVLFPRRTVGVFEAIANRVLPSSMRRPVIDALEAFLSGVGILRNVRLMGEAVLWSLVLWLVNSLGFWVAFRAFGLPLSLTAAIFFQSCLAFVVSVPAAPGFWGTYEWSAKLVLVDLWGQDASRSLACAVGFHITGFLPVTLMGLYYAWKLGLSLKGVARTEVAVEQAVEQATTPPAAS